MNDPGPNRVGADVLLSDLSGAVFDEATLVLSSFVQSRLAGARFEQADLEQVVFDTTTLTGATFRRARLTDVVFRDVDLANAEFTFIDVRPGKGLGPNGRPEEVTFERADLSGARFFFELDDLGLQGPVLEDVLENHVHEVLGGLTWVDTICPDGSNSDDPLNGGSCEQAIRNQLPTAP